MTRSPAAHARVAEPITIALPAEALDQIIEAVTERVLATLTARDDEQWPRWMNVETAARYIDASPQRIRKLVARREIPYSQQAPGCRVHFDRHAIDDWLTATATTPRNT
jgi:excisionase family DNA binding protein